MAARAPPPAAASGPREGAHRAGSRVCCHRMWRRLGGSDFARSARKNCQASPEGAMLRVSSQGCLQGCQSISDLLVDVTASCPVDCQSRRAFDGPERGWIKQTPAVSCRPRRRLMIDTCRSRELGIRRGFPHGDPASARSNEQKMERLMRTATCGSVTGRAGCTPSGTVASARHDGGAAVRPCRDETTWSRGDKALTGERDL